jgi:hypothetical protein
MHARPAWISVLLTALLAMQAGAAPTHRIIRITLPASAPHAVSGRLLLFAAPAPPGAPPAALDADEFTPQSVTVAAQDVDRLAPGGTVEIDADTQAYPAGFSALPPGPTLIQAVLDVRRDYAYAGRAAGDLTSKVASVTMAQGAGIPALTLTDTVPAADPWAPHPGAPAPAVAALAAARGRATPVTLPSHLLERFWGRPVALRAWVLTPPGYDPASPKNYPAVYYLHGYGGSFTTLTGPLAYVDAAMQHHDMPPMIWVFLDQSSPTGTHEFADSLNNGFWGAALTRELMPYLEAKFHMRPDSAGRYLTGHSSGGWAGLWLQTRYPGLFGGTWSTAPDPADFHDFTGIDLYAPNANMYRHADGSPVPLMRMPGKLSPSLEAIAKLERVLGPAGGQFASFDWVFSPRGPDGRPVPMFDRDTGAVDPAVVAYWGENYDIAHRVRTHWPLLKAALTGKIHVIVGDADTFFLDGAAHRLQTVLDGLGAQAHFSYLPGRSHFDLYKKGGDAHGLMKDIAAEIYKVAASAKPEATDDDSDDDTPAPPVHGQAPAKPAALPHHN